MNRILLILFFVFFRVLFFFGEESAGKTGFPEYKSIKEGEITFSWRVSGENLNVQLTSPASGWTAVGFDPEIGMKGANIIIGYVENGKAVIEDHYGTGIFSHKSDISLGGKDDVTDKSGFITNDILQLNFTVPLDSGDKYDKKLVQGNSYNIILAYGSSNNILSKHKKRYKTKITL